MSLLKSVTKVMATTIIFSFIGATSAFAASKGVILGDKINVREFASTDSNVVQTLDKGTVLNISDKQDSWYIITLKNGSTAYVGEQWVGLTSADGTANADLINVREKPSKDSNILVQINIDEVFNVVGIIGDFYKVEYDDGYAYISKDYLSGNMLSQLPTVAAPTETAEEAKATYAVVTPDSGMFLRAEKDLDSSVLEVLDKGAIVDIESASGEWLKVTTDSDTVGYVKAEFVSQRTGEKPARVKAERTEDKVVAKATTKATTKTTTKATTKKAEKTEKSKKEETSTASLSNEALSTAQQIIAYGKKFIGTPYVWGGTSLSRGVDCSGFVYSVFKTVAGITLNRTSSSMTGNGTKISRDNLKTGDVIFFDTAGANNGRICHVGIYIGNGQFIHSSSSSNHRGITISNLGEGYYSKAYVTARRML